MANKTICLHSRSDSKLCDISWLHPKIKFRLLQLFFADDVTIYAHGEQEYERLLSDIAGTCLEFTLTISHKKTVIMHMGPPKITVDKALKVVFCSSYFGSIISDHLQLHKELDKRLVPPLESS